MYMMYLEVTWIQFSEIERLKIYIMLLVYIVIVVLTNIVDEREWRN